MVWAINKTDKDVKTATAGQSNASSCPVVCLQWWLKTCLLLFCYNWSPTAFIKWPPSWSFTPLITAISLLCTSSLFLLDKPKKPCSLVSIYRPIIHKHPILFPARTNTSAIRPHPTRNKTWKAYHHCIFQMALNMIFQKGQQLSIKQ